MLLENSDVLQTLAEVSITLAGFSGLILVFQQGDTAVWGARDKNSIQHLLITSFGAFFASLLPLVSMELFDDANTLWRVYNPLVATVLHGLGPTMAIVATSKQEFSIPKLWAIVLIPVSYLILVLSWLTALGFLSSFAATIYLFGIAWLLVVSMSLFVSMIFDKAQQARSN
jgi:hypothetical protein